MSGKGQSLSSYGTYSTGFGKSKRVKESLLWSWYEIREICSLTKWKLTKWINYCIKTHEMNQIHEMKQFPGLFNETSLENPVDIENGGMP